MSAARDEQAHRSLVAARVAATATHEANVRSHAARLRFLRDARRAGWTWERIGVSMDVSANAARRFWNRHRLEAGRLT